MKVIDPSTLLGHGPCLRMNKDPHICQPKFDTWTKSEEGRRLDHSETDESCEWEVWGEKADGSTDQGSRGAKTPREYFK